VLPQVTGFVHCPTGNTTGQDLYEQFYTLMPNGTASLSGMINTGEFFILRSKATRKYCRAITGKRSLQGALGLQHARSGSGGCARGQGQGLQRAASAPGSLQPRREGAWRGHTCCVGRPAAAWP
jgi:hypothetical protein